MDFKKIENLIENKEYQKAEKQLEVIKNDTKNSEKEISIANNLIGYIHTCWDYKEKSDCKAKRALLNCIESSYHIPYAFYLYADVEEDKNVAINYLKIGLEEFPNNPQIYIGILKYSSKSEQLKTINEIKEKGLNDDDLIKDVIQLLISYDLWDDVYNLSHKVIENNNVSDHQKNHLQLLCAYSKLLTRDEKTILEALEIFESLVKEDIQNFFNYSHYMGAIGCTIFLKDYIKVKQYFDKLLINNSVQDLNASPFCIVDVNFVKIYIPIFDELSKIFSIDKDRKQKNDCLKALYLFSPYEMFGTVRFSKKHINDLKKYYSSNMDNLVVGCVLFNMECALKLYFSSYLTYMEMLNHYLNPNDRDVYVSTSIDNCSNEDFEKVYEDSCKKVVQDSEMNMSLFVTQIMDLIIARLWGIDINKRNYQKILSIPDKLNISYLVKSNKLFEIAYSYWQNKNPKAKSIYELLLKKEPRNSAALNNLGVIFEECGDILKAEKYFSDANENSNTDELILNNLKRVKTRLAKYTTAFEKVKNEPIWFIGRLSLFYDIANESGEIQCTYKNRPVLLKVGPEKANELIDKMIENGYLEKISNGSYQVPTKYIINPWIKSFLLEKRSRIESNIVYEKISEKINIDTIEKIGYTNEVIDLLNNIVENDFREILKRDLRECVICLITEQKKAAIIMCGSIIEALLMSKILGQKIEKYDIGLLLNRDTKIKKVKDMDLNELLFVIDKENLIKKEHFYLSHFARGYRNIIHPACEIRKGFEVTNEEATFMWDILLRIIRAILSD